MSLQLCFPCAEFAPFAKAGGLGDVSAALAGYLHRQGHDVRVVLPHYRSVREAGLDVRPVPQLAGRQLRYGPHSIAYSMLEARRGASEAPIYLVDCPDFFDRDALYGDSDHEHLRFAMLCDATIDLCEALQWAPDIMHCHDWHTALVPLYLRTLYAWDRLFARTRSVLTIHNIAFQGVFGTDILYDMGLQDHRGSLSQEDLAQDRINFMKSGVLFADLLTTVSPTYAREILSPEYGMGLQELLRQRHGSLIGILNGVDFTEWNPRSDPLIPHTYNARSTAGKKQNKQALLQELGLADSADLPLIGMVSRLTWQKGLDLVQQVVPRMLEQRRFALVVLGSGETRYEQFFHWLQQSFPDRVCFWRGFNNRLAHWIEAGSDLFLMPSLFEPCGLNQMYSLRYGTPPIVRRTGGLADSVQLFDPATGQGTGIVFDHYDATGLRWAIDFGLQLYQDKRSWRKLMQNGMAMDYSWKRQGQVYVDVFRQLTGR